MFPTRRENDATARRLVDFSDYAGVSRSAQFERRGNNSQDITIVLIRVRTINDSKIRNVGNSASEFSDVSLVPPVIRKVWWLDPTISSILEAFNSERMGTLSTRSMKW